MNRVVNFLIVLALLSLNIFALECEYAIKPEFDYAQAFSNTTGVVTKNGTQYVTDRFGNLVNFEGKAIKVRSNGLVMVVGDNDKAAFFDVNGYRLTEYVYDTYPVIDAKTGIKTNRFGYYDGDGNSDLVPFSKDNKYGFINSKGQEVIPAKYEYARGFVEGMALICAEGILSEYGTYTNGKYGMITEDGREILPADSYWVGTRVKGFGYGLFYNGPANKFLGDKSGNVIKTDENGFAPIDADFIRLEAADGRLGVADRTGNYIVPLGNYSQIERVGNQFVVGRKKIVNADGKTVFQADENEYLDVHYVDIYKKSNLYRISKSSSDNCLYGFVNAYGKVVFEPVYSSLYDIGEGLIVAQKDNKNYLYSYYGEELCQLNGNNVGECVEGLFTIFDFTSEKYGYMLNPLSHPKVYINGEKCEFDVYPKIENDRTLVPLRGVFEALNATVSWDDITKTVTAVKDSVTVTLQIGSNILYKNGEAVEIDVPAKIENSRTLVPLRAVSEALDCSVGWDCKNRVVNIEEINSEKQNEVA